MVRKRYTVAVVGLGGATAAQRSEVSRHRRERDALAAAGDERDRLAITYGHAARNYHISVECDGEVIHKLHLESNEVLSDVEIVRRHVPSDSPGERSAPDDFEGSDGGTAEHPLVSSDVVPAADPHDAESTRPDEAGDAGRGVPWPDDPDSASDTILDAPRPAPEPEVEVADDDADPPVTAGPADDDVAPDDVPLSPPAHDTDEEPVMHDTASAILPGARFARSQSTSRRAAMPTWDDVPSGPVPAEVLRYFESAVEREEARHAQRGRDEDAA